MMLAIAIASVLLAALLLVWERRALTLGRRERIGARLRREVDEKIAEAKRRAVVVDIGEIFAAIGAAIAAIVNIIPGVGQAVSAGVAGATALAVAGIEEAESSARAESAEGERILRERIDRIVSWVS